VEISLVSLPVPDVLRRLATKYTDKDSRIELAGYEVKNATLRLRCFAVYGVVCYICGLEGKRFRFCRAGDQPGFHLNLYADGPDGVEVLMTHDHIIPRSAGGRDRLDNVRPCCAPCNFEKGPRHG
jgi:5-methylcytosine-specific restriction endonuclease McrA